MQNNYIKLFGFGLKISVNTDQKSIFLNIEYFSKHCMYERLYGFKTSFTGIYGQPQTSSIDDSYSK